MGTAGLQWLLNTGISHSADLEHLVTFFFKETIEMKL